MNIRIKLQMTFVLLVALFGAASAAFGGASADLVPEMPAARLAGALTSGDSPRRLRLRDVPLDGTAAPVTLVLERFEVFRPQARIIVHQRRQRTILKPPVSAYFRGSIEGVPDSVAVVSVDESGDVRGIVQSSERTWVLGRPRPSTAGENTPDLASREFQPVQAPEAVRPFQCGVDRLPRQPADARLSVLAAAPLPPGEAYKVPVAIETDAEFYNRFGGSGAAASYIGNLFAYASTIYLREAGAELSIDSVSLWAGGVTSDPWNHTSTESGLYSFRDYWNANRKDTPRAIAHFLSGKSLGGGIAYLGVLCNKTVGYGYSANISGDFSVENPRTVWDILVVTHEIGHNFDSPHTHDYENVAGESRPVDDCPAGMLPSLGSLTGGIAGSGAGTIMSYCHLLPPYYSNISMTFGQNHPYGVNAYRVSDLIRNYVADVAAANPSCIGLSGGQKYNLTVTKTGIGTVTSFPAAINCGTTCSAPFREGTAVILTATPASGNQMVEWGGDCAGQGGASCMVEMLRDRSATAQFKSASNIVLSTSASAPKYGDEVTLTATLDSAASTGSVTFKDGSTTLGSGNLSNGKASLATSGLTVGNHSIVAGYSGDANFAGATSGMISVVVGKRGSTTALSASPAAAQYGDAVKLTATVTGKAPSGTVSFKDGLAGIGSAMLVDGQAAIVVSSLAVGSHKLSAGYGGDTNHTASTGGIAGFSVGKVASSTALVATPAAPTYGAKLVFIATVSGKSPTGKVSFKDGTTTLGTANVNGGQAAFSTSSLAVGNHAIAAIYSGDSKHTGSSHNVDVTVDKAATSTALSASATTATYGTGITFTAMVKGASPTGAVTFRDGAAALGTGVLTQGKASLSSILAVGEHRVTAEYSGDARNAGSSSVGVAETVNKASSTTVLSASPAEPKFGDGVILSASIAGKSPSGTVAFSDGAMPLGSAAVANGKATLAVSNLAVGLHSIIASYGGDGNLSGSTSAALAVNVAKRASSTAVAVSPTAPKFGDPVTVTATIDGKSPTGSVTFRDGTAVIGSGPLVGGHASIVVSNLAVGGHGISATYAGDGNHAASASSTANVTVGKLASSAALAVSSPAPKFGEDVMLAVTVSGNAPTGTVTFKVGTITLGTVALTEGRAALTTAKLAVGNHRVTASYPGDVRHLGSSAVIDLAIAKADSNTGLMVSAATAPYGSRLSLTAKVFGSTPTGTVSFRDGAVLLGTKFLSGGGAALSTTSLPVGMHSLAAIYSGDKNHAPSSSPAIEVLVTERASLR